MNAELDTDIEDTDADYSDDSPLLYITIPEHATPAQRKTIDTLNAELQALAARREEIESAAPPDIRASLKDIEAHRKRQAEQPISIRQAALKIFDSAEVQQFALACDAVSKDKAAKAQAQLDALPTAEQVKQSTYLELVAALAALGIVVPEKSRTQLEWQAMGALAWWTDRSARFTELEAKREALRRKMNYREVAAEVRSQRQALEAEIQKLVQKLAA